jgi:hypothetical protein
LAIAAIGLGIWLVLADAAAAGKTAVPSAPAALPALNAAQHFALAKAVLARTKQPDFRDSESVEDGVFHAEEALRLGYPEKKETQLLLLQLLDIAGSRLSECGAVYDPNATSLPERCKQHEMAWRKWKSLLGELYKTYPDDTYIMFRYANSPLGNPSESELILRRLAVLEPDNLSLKRELEDIDNARASAKSAENLAWVIYFSCAASLVLVMFRRTSLALALSGLILFLFWWSSYAGFATAWLAITMTPFIMLAFTMTLVGFWRVGNYRKLPDRNFNQSQDGAPKLGWMSDFRRPK